ncbi:hypothetical protein BV509_12145 [Rhodovulum sulfidophilum]|nr:hypothetical protein [Rhodovulum visakhapatnamense]OLS45014.1 hypothetical protein BV509_12145 [Rhodovulum sulfidophilum]
MAVRPDLVVARAAIDMGGTEPGSDGVVSGAAEDRGVVAGRIDGIVARGAKQLIVARPARQCVIAVAAEDRGALRSAVDGVVARAARDGVGALVPLDLIAPVGARQAVAGPVAVECRHASVLRWSPPRLWAGAH